METSALAPVYPAQAESGGNAALFCICGIAAIEATEILSDSGGRSEVFSLLLILDLLYDGDPLYMGGEIDGEADHHQTEPDYR